ncbi:MAG: bifunctional folylpolyglutamate synthase/dihydrofolate synthase, partial [Solirubrobacterales bacterium]|nr:bifunctional folylpolyglutamate synthase/dihydrofolate synthase [Solirubrobacterales bacterium]
MSWTSQRAEEYLARLEPIGWRFGLERMRRLVSLLGMPQHRFASVHVVGTNGKSSVTAVTAALLEAHGMRAGAYLSPHTSRWTERITIGGQEIGAADLALALERVAQSATALERALEPGDRVTQYEAVTAAAFVALAAARVDVAVIEAGLGGRLDATNVLPSRVTVLSSVGLEHTELLGETEEQIAAEKLAVLRGHSTLVVGRLSPSVRELARRRAGELSARFVDVRELSSAVELSSAAPYLRRDFAVSLAAAETILGRLEPERVMEVAAGLELPGRMELLDGDPPTLIDAAHNPAGAAALAEALPEVIGERPVIACLAILPGKDAAGIVTALAPRLDGLVATRVPAAAMSGLGRPGAS